LLSSRFSRRDDPFPDFTLQGPAKVSFTLDFPASTPAHYSVEIQSDGKAHYESRSKGFRPNLKRPTVLIMTSRFHPAARERIFELTAKGRGTFTKDLDSHRKNLAFTGKKTLGYKDERRSGESTFKLLSGWGSTGPDQPFQGLSATLELGHRLEYSLRYQKTGNWRKN